MGADGENARGSPFKKRKAEGRGKGVSGRGSLRHTKELIKRETYDV